MSKKSILGAFVIVLTLGIPIIALIFGENLYERVTGRSPFGNPQQTVTPMVVILATTIPTVTVEVSPTIPPVSSEPMVTDVPQPLSPTAKLDMVVVSEPKIVSGKDSDGEIWHAPATGIYRLEYSSGAYSPWPDATGCDPKGCWKTTIFIYKNRDVVWLPNGTMIQPGEPDWSIGDDAWQQTPELAEEIAGMSNGVVIELETGDYLNLIAVDGKESPPGGFSAYSEGQNHKDGVHIDIVLISQ